MRGRRWSTAIVPRSLPRTATVRPAGNGFAGKVFVPEGRIRHVSFGRRTLRPVGDIELGRHGPEALEVIVTPGLHDFREQARRYYDLEGLCRMRPKLDSPDRPYGPFSDLNMSYA